MDAITIYDSEITPICVGDLFRLRTLAMERGWESARWRIGLDQWDSITMMKDAQNRYLVTLPLMENPFTKVSFLGFPVNIDPMFNALAIEQVSTHCGYCGRKIGKGTHCTGCGAPYPSDETCAYCGSGIPTGAIKCTGCGHD